MNHCRVEWGHFYFFHAYDVGFDISLAEAGALCEAAVSPGLTGMRPAPPHIQYRPMPLVVPSGAVEIRHEGKAFPMDAFVKIFDFGVLSVTLCLPVRDMPWEEYVENALHLAAGGTLEGEARRIASNLFGKIRPAVTRPGFFDLVEEYNLWHVGKFSPGLTGSEALARFPQDISRLLLLERGSFSEETLGEILRSPIRYFDNDVCLPDWSAAFIYDPRYRDTVEVLEFLNAQMLELRFFDRILHAAIDNMAEELRKKRGILSVLHDPYEAPLRKLSEIKMDVSLLRERINNALKLAGDLYLARIYEEARRKAGAEKWEGTIRDQLKTLEDIYTVLNNRATASRTETLEAIIVLLIVLEIVMGFFRR